MENKILVENSARYSSASPVSWWSSQMMAVIT